MINVLLKSRNSKMDVNSINKINNPNFTALRITKSAYSIGESFIKNDKKPLEELAKTCNIKISEGSEFMGAFSQPCLKVKVTPLNRCLNPFVRLFNLDAATGKFETKLRNIRPVNSSLFSLTKALAEKIVK